MICWVVPVGEPPGEEEIDKMIRKIPSGRTRSDLHVEALIERIWKRMSLAPLRTRAINRSNENTEVTLT